MHNALFSGFLLANAIYSDKMTFLVLQSDEAIENYIGLGLLGPKPQAKIPRKFDIPLKKINQWHDNP
jgi:hypothetical protein